MVPTAPKARAVFAAIAAATEPAIAGVIIHLKNSFLKGGAMKPRQ